MNQAKQTSPKLILIKQKEYVNLFTKTKSNLKKKI